VPGRQTRVKLGRLGQVRVARLVQLFRRVSGTHGEKRRFLLRPLQRSLATVDLDLEAVPFTRRGLDDDDQQAARR
jgi:hypothetical protein